MLFSNTIQERVVDSRETKTARKNFDGDDDRRPCSALLFGDGCRDENVRKTTRRDADDPSDCCENNGNGADDIVTGTKGCHYAAHPRITASDKSDESTDESLPESRPHWQWFTNYCGWLPNWSIVTDGDQRAIRQRHRRHHHLHHHHHHHHLHRTTSMLITTTTSECF